VAICIDNSVVVEDVVCGDELSLELDEVSIIQCSKITSPLTSGRLNFGAGSYFEVNTSSR
jgi:hypothetical protein